MLRNAFLAIFVLTGGLVVCGTASADVYSHPWQYGQYWPGGSGNNWSYGEIAARTTTEAGQNVSRFCLEQEGNQRLAYTRQCGENENHYADWSPGDGQWFLMWSGSASCFRIINTATCGWTAPKVLTNGGVLRVWTNNPATDADLACQALGMSGAIDYSTEQVAGGANYAINFFGAFVSWPSSGTVNLLSDLVCE